MFCVSVSGDAVPTFEDAMMDPKNKISKRRLDMRTVDVTKGERTDV